MARPGIRHLLECHKPLPITVYRHAGGGMIHLKTIADYTWVLQGDLRFRAMVGRKSILLTEGRAIMYSDDEGFTDIDARNGYTSRRLGARRPDMSEEGLSIIKAEYRKLLKQQD